ncbi:hypothetical protein FRC04_007423 [Tulasnella sp. 424]|nr:hypothetical protein FRC04_007423 [Tulasnella sp. 424]KAG8959722.1 hypothetical protein FRC05_007586 [Tulasnella sp. 425]
MGGGPLEDGCAAETRTRALFADGDGSTLININITSPLIIFIIIKTITRITNPWNTGAKTASSDVGPLSSSSAFPPTTATASSDPNPPATGSPSDAAIDLASLLDPLHFPSLLFLALSTLPEIKPRIILPAAFTLLRRSDDLDERLAAGVGGQKRSGESAMAVLDEKRGLVVEDEREEADGRGGGDGRPAAIMLYLPAVEAIAAAADALGLWAGVTVNGELGS